jgi:hypothetical protein
MRTKSILLSSIALTVLIVVFLVGCSERPEGPVGPNERVHPMQVISDFYITEGMTVDLIAGQEMDAGDVSATISGSDLCIEFAVADGWELVETHLWVGDYLSGMPQTRKGNPQVGHFPYASGDITGETTWTACIPLVELGDDPCDLNLVIAAHAAVRLPLGNDEYQTETGWADGDRMVNRGNWATYYNILISCSNPEGPVDEINCETAFAFGDEYASCFSEIDETINRWGWSNGPLGAGTYTFDIYAGAGQCDLSKGDIVGHLTVDYDGSSAVVTYQMYGEFVMDEVHLYVGNGVLPLDGNGEQTVAPGQYPEVWDELGGVDTYSITVEGLSGDIYVVAHAVVCGPFEYDCAEWIVYGSNLNAGGDFLDDALYAYDLFAQTQTLVYDPTPIDNSQNYPNGNAYDPDNNRIYFGTDDGRLFYHEIGSGTHVQVEGGATSGSFGTMACGSWYNGKYYYIQNGTNRLYEVSIVSDVASRTQVGTVPTSSGYGDIAFDPANPGVFVAAAGGVWYWYDLNDSSSATLTAVGGDGSHKQLAYGSDGVLYGVNAVGGEFYTIVYDRGAGTVTLDFFWDSPYTYTDLASGPLCQ